MVGFCATALPSGAAPIVSSFSVFFCNIRRLYPCDLPKTNRNPRAIHSKERTIPKIMASECSLRDGGPGFLGLAWDLRVGSLLTTHDLPSLDCQKTAMTQQSYALLKDS